MVALSKILNEMTVSELHLNKQDILHVDEDIFVLPGDLVIDGHGAIIEGNGSNKLQIENSNITLKNLALRNFHTVINIDGKGQNVENIRVENCVFENYRAYGVLIASTLSNSTVQNIKILDSVFNGPVKSSMGHDDVVAGVYGVMIQAAYIPDESDVENCVLHDITVDHCRAYRGNRCAVWLSGITSPDLTSGVPTGRYGKARNIHISGITITNNDFHDCGDATINLISAMGGQDDTIVEDVNISNNVIEQGIWGIFVIAGEPLIDGTRNICLRNVTIDRNTIYPFKRGVGEATYGIAVMAGRNDYFPNVHVENCLTENIKIRQNSIRDLTTGIIVAAADCLVDGDDCVLRNCKIQNIEIDGNRISNVTYGVKLLATWMEGRAFDYMIDVPPRNHTWVPFKENHRDVTVVAEDNSISNVVIKGNILDGYRFQYMATGAYAFGHCRVNRNRLTNVITENNTFINGEGHVHILDEILHDYVIGCDNSVDAELRWSLN